MNLRRGSTASPIKYGEHLIGFDHIVDSHLQQSSLLGIHRSFPELLRIHFTETFVTLNRKVFLRCSQHFFQQRLARGYLFAGAVLSDDEGRGERVFQLMNRSRAF